MTRPVVALLWNRFFDVWPSPDADAAAVPVEFTTDRVRFDEADAVVFHVPTLDGLPATRPRGQCWVAWSMESVVTTPAMTDPAFLTNIDLIVSYQRSADVWFPYVGEASRAALLTPPAPKSADRPVCHFQSNPYDRSGRTRYVVELLKRIKVASYGTVLPTVPDPGQVQGRNARLAVMARHKFTLAFENSIASDYVSDKFFDALIAGSVPVYLGAPDIADFAPAHRSFIDVADFAGPAELAAYLDHLDRHDDEYDAYLAWKQDGFRPEFEELLARAVPDPLTKVAELVHERRRG